MSLDTPHSRRAFLRRSFGIGAALAALPAVTASAQPAKRLTLEERVSQLFVVSFSGTSLQPDFASLLQRYPFGGVVLFARNCGTPQQLRPLLADLQRTARRPLLVCTDQEGGIVVRITQGAPVFPSEQWYGQLGSTDRVLKDAATTARDLRALGLTMNLAPVVDVLGNATSPIGSRSYGSDPRQVARLSAAAIRGYQQNGLASTAKHFIGLGHTSVDSHQSLPTVSLSLAQLEQADLIPFRSAISAGVSSILVAHVALPKIDPSGRPASLSPVIIQNVLRHRLGFNGVLMTDSLLMGAVSGAGKHPAVEALAAGADILLMGVNKDVPDAVFETAIAQVTAAIRDGHIPKSRLTTALRRINALKRRYPPL
jgi:beta-N-acetylhexosaminidase